MGTRSKLGICAFVGAALLLLLWTALRRPDDGVPVHAERLPATRQVRPANRVDRMVRDSAPASPRPAPGRFSDAVARLVEAFDVHVDAWQAPRAEGASLKDAEEFRDRLMKLPEDLRTEELDRALVLVPDENAFIFAALLFDKTQPPEMLDNILCDMLNRDDDIKDVMLKKIHADRDHPCWEDVDWLLSATSPTGPSQKVAKGRP